MKRKMREIAVRQEFVYRVTCQVADVGVNGAWHHQQCEVRFVPLEGGKLFNVQVWPFIRLFTSGKIFEPDTVQVTQKYEFLSHTKKVVPEFGTVFDVEVTPTAATAKAVAKAHYDPERAKSYLRKFPEIRRSKG